MNNSFLKNQNDEELIHLLRASTYAYAKAKNWENLTTFVLLFLAFAYPIFYALSHNDALKLILFQFSFFISVNFSKFNSLFSQIALELNFN